MTQSPPVISYASPVTGCCPLCQTRPISKKSIYDHHVCKKCYYKFTNRRQLDYLVDALIVLVTNIAIVLLLNSTLLKSGVSQIFISAINFIVGLGLVSAFCFRDGIAGRSPGKWLANLQVLSETDSQPISFGQSFKRNCILLIGEIPLVGPLAVSVIVIIMAVQVGGGYRLGDRFAKTKVIWLKYADSPVFRGNPTLCTGCGYNLLGNVSGVCPECGKAVSPELRDQAIAIA